MCLILSRKQKRFHYREQKLGRGIQMKRHRREMVVARRHTRAPYE